MTGHGGVVPGVPDAAAAAAGPERAEAEELVRALVKTLRIRTLYEPNNPVFREFSDALVERLERFLAAYGQLRIEVREHELLVDGAPVYRDEGTGESLPFTLHRGGVREVSFLEGLEREELFGFLETVKPDPHRDPKADDVLARLWERDFVHVRYLFVDLFLSEETIELPDLPEPGSGELSAVPGGAVSRDDAAAPAAPAGEPVRLGAAPLEETVRLADPAGERQADVREILEAGAESAVVRITPEDFDPTLYFLEAEEIRLLHEEIEEAKERNLLLDYLELLRELALLDAGSDDVEPIAALEELFDTFFANGNLETVLRVHTLAGELRASAGLSAAKAAALERLANGLLEPRNLARLSTLADETAGDEAEREALAACLGRAADADLGVAVERLGDLKRLAHREELLAPLADAAVRNPAALRRLFSHPDPAVVRNAVFLAGRAGAASAPEALAEPLRSPDAEVRIEAVHALKAHRTPEALALLVEAVEDPDKLVRYYAVRNLVASGYAPALGAVEAAIADRGFAAKDLTEKKLLFEALGRFAGAAAVPRLRDLLGRRGVFRRADTRELRVCAAVALGEIATPEARVLLQEHAGDRDPDVREACEQALARLRR